MTEVLISAGDASGDRHAAEFVRALRGRRPGVGCTGLGGDEMGKAGVELVAHQRDLAIGGLVELLGGARRIHAAWRTMVAALERVRPDLVVLVDSGGFNLPFARHVKRHSQARVLYYVAPQVWAWRRGRIRKLAARVDRLAVIFPFEPEVYADTGLAVDYVGHPLVEPLTDLAARCDRATARRALGIEVEGEWLAIFPGSRSNEIRKQLPVQLEAAKCVHSRRPETRFVLVVAPSVSRRQVDELVTRARLPVGLTLEIVEGSSSEAMLACDVALAKPGTVTVELALLRRPMVVVGRASALTAAVVRRAVDLPSLTMPNLIAGETVVPELLQEDAKPSAIADALEPLFEGEARTRQLSALEVVRARLGEGGASARAAAIAEEMLGTPRA